MPKAPTHATIEIDGPQNQNVYFRPITRTVRGRFDVHRLRDPGVGKLLTEWPEPIPGQLVSVDYASGTGAVIEPLYEAKSAAIREKIELLGMRLPPEREEFQGVHVATWTHFLKALVEGGSATLISGEFAESDDPVRTRFHSSERADPVDEMRENLAKLGDAVATMAASNARMVDAIERILSKQTG